MRASPRKRRRTRNILAVAAVVIVVGAVIGVATVALLDNATLRSQATAADARAATAQAAAKSDYAARNAALNRQSQVVAAEIGELRANTIRSDGMYLVGHDIKPGTWHTVGDGGASGGKCAYAVNGSASTLQHNIYFDGPWTVDLSGAYAFSISGPCTWVRVPS